MAALCCVTEGSGRGPLPGIVSVCRELRQAGDLCVFVGVLLEALQLRPASDIGVRIFMCLDDLYSSID